jgi:hypothetical protein
MVPGDLSPDRLWRWDGSSWMPTGTSVPPLQPSGSSRRRPWPAIAAGVIAMLAGVLILIASELPYVHYTDSTNPSSVSIFNTGFAPSNWFALEPVGVALLALAAGVVLVASTSRLLRAIASGALIASGPQSLLMFAGYVLLAATSASAQTGPGGFVGLLAGLLLFAAGVTAAVGVFSGRDTPAA